MFQKTSRPGTRGDTVKLWIWALHQGGHEKHSKTVAMGSAPGRTHSKILAISFAPRWTRTHSKTVAMGSAPGRKYSKTVAMSFAPGGHTVKLWLWALHQGTHN